MTASAIKETMKPLVLYLKSAKPSNKTLAELRDAGYVPVVVDSMQDAALLIPRADSDLVAQAALRVIANSDLNTRRVFGDAMLNILQAPKQS